MIITELEFFSFHSEYISEADFLDLYLIDFIEEINNDIVSSYYNYQFDSINNYTNYYLF